MAERLQTEDFDYQGMVILGASGNIGTRLIERVTESDYPEGEHINNPDLANGKNPINHQHPTKIIAIADSTHYYVALEGISAEVLRASENTRVNVKNLLAEKGTPHNGDLTAISKEITFKINATNEWGGGVPIKEAHVGYVDLTDSRETRILYNEVVNNTKSAVVAVSKKVLGYATKAEFDAYQQSGRVELLPTVGAGMDAIAHLASYPESRESLLQVDAMVSGTNLAICKGLESEAYQKGQVDYRLSEKKITC
ncbi:hypothetical protein GW756_01450 [bacterium]|nr:hypothetical protein [bacterium]NCQ55020.1 hypothetical protein [Candidatus Parcubacteria bacterium]NCS67064.1 hypothetical protein [Candidatus Peregrinibacteria bacterium]NCS96010.1 hypothetical protein [bacterium]